MIFRKMFPCVLVACSVMSLLLATTVHAQTGPRPVTTTGATSGVTRLETDPVIISLAEDEEKNSMARPPAALRPSPRLQVEQMLLAAIDTRIGAPYVYGAAGPNVYDCSGFVWSVFQSAGIRFDRGSARGLWTRFAPARPDDEFKFGTLVFFSGLSHVGIVADEKGFYHASRSRGVVYSRFNDYWLSRIDGFRRVPLPVPLVAE
jgi:cell wall-associated NlpC family hydrolase